MKIPFFPYPQFFLHDKEEYIKIFSAVCSKGAYILQEELVTFEKEICDLTGSKYCLGVANATDALQMAFMAGDLEIGSEVIIASHTMIATASAVKYAGGEPIPVDSGPDHLMDVESVRGAITEKTQAIVPTQLNGRTCNMDEITLIADEFNLDIYEDSAQALGSKFKGKSAGTFGIGGCISFYPAKTLGCFGDGGAILCQNEDIYKKLLLLRDHGRNEENDVVLWGMNSRLDNIQAAFMSHKLKEYKQTIIRRREIAAIYSHELQNIDSIVLPPPPNDGDHYDIFQNYEIQSDNRDSLKEYLSKDGIGSLIQWSGKPVHQFTKIGFNQNLPKSDELFKRLLMLPMHPFLKDEEVLYISDSLKNFYN